VRWPAGGLTGGRDVDRLTAHIDLLPTFVDICSLKKPRNVKLDGASIAPLLHGRSDEWPDRILITDSQRIENPEKWRKSAVMTDRWRLVNGAELYEIKQDPGQKNNVAADHPQVVTKLRRAYERWWDDVSERFDEYCPVILGADQENPTRLMSHDWHTPRVPWNQGAVRSGMQANGFWAVDVVRPGRYEIELRRWPKEAGAAINAAIPGGKAISATKARLKVGDIDVTQPVTANAKGVVFTVNLTKGETKLQSWLIDDNGGSRGAYYVYVKRV
jgi:arylsulfatase B